MELLDDAAGPTELRWRDLHLLHVHHDTLRCALTRCIACCYKLVLHSRPGLLPNVRPEMCLRMAALARAKAEDAKPEETETKEAAAVTEAAEHRVGLYDAAQVKQILTVGDGNFSYSLALARGLGPDVRLVATSHESKQSVLDTYPDGGDILAELHALPNVEVQHEVDATDAKQMKALGSFDRVIWNFPCVRAPRGEDGQNQEMEMNKKLLKDFFAHVAQVLTPTGEVHVTHKTKAPFGQWGIEAIAASCGLHHQKSVIFDRCLYPGYSNKKVLSKGSFPIWDSQTFIFVPESRMEAETETTDAKETDVKASGDDILTPVTTEHLKTCYLLLTPSYDDQLRAQNKRKRKGKNGGGGKRKEAAASNGKRTKQPNRKRRRK